MHLRLTLCAQALLLAFPFASAHAQISNPSSSGNETQLPTVTVVGEGTGSYKSNSVQVGTFRDVAPIDVPQTSNVVTRGVMDAQSVTTVYGALRNTAGVTRSQLGGSTYDNIAIRGILVENRGNYRLNGSLPIINLIDIPLENKERVEVLKGASSLYYGFVPPSGIINFVTKRAGKDPVSAVAVSANEHGAATVHTDIGRKFGEQQQFGVRINAVAGREDIGIDNYSGNRGLLSAALDFKATSSLNFKLDLEHYRKNVSEQAALRLPTAVGGVITLPGVPDAKQNLAGEWQKYDAEATNMLFRTDYAINDNWSALFEAGKARTQRDRHFSQFENYNLATGQGTLRIFFQPGAEWDNTNYRTEITGRIPGRWATHDVTFGYTANERNQNATNAGNVTAPQNLYNPVPVAPRSPAVATANNISSIEDRGWYVSDRLSFGEQWQVMAGVRSGQYESTSRTARYEADEINPTAAVIYKPTRNLSVYASYLEGVEESGQAGTNFANAGALLPPAVARQKEVGVKAQVAEGVLLQAAYFDIKRPSTGVDAANRFVLNGLAQYRGVELAASGEITKQLSVIGSALFMDSEQLNAANTATFGKTPDNTPDRTGSLFAEYRLAGVPGLALSGGVIYVGERPVNNENQAFVGGYSTISLGARYTTKLAGQRTTFQAVVDNATNRDYWSTAGSGYISAGAPRTLKLAAKVEF
jgi:iron complex outermembrane receptor protein